MQERTASRKRSCPGSRHHVSALSRDEYERGQDRDLHEWESHRDSTWERDQPSKAPLLLVGTVRDDEQSDSRDQDERDLPEAEVGPQDGVQHRGRLLRVRGVRRGSQERVSRLGKSYPAHRMKRGRLDSPGPV